MADLVVLALDQSLPMDRAIVEAYSGAIRVANKSDAPPRWDAREIDAIQTVAIDGRGMDELRMEIRRRFGCEPLDLDRARWWTQAQRLELRTKLSNQ